mgnify:FL=1
MGKKRRLIKKNNKFSSKHSNHPVFKRSRLVDNTEEVSEDKVTVSKPQPEKTINNNTNNLNKTEEIVPAPIKNTETKPKVKTFQTSKKVTTKTKQKKVTVSKTKKAKKTKQVSDKAI